MIPRKRPPWYAEAAALKLQGYSDREAAKKLGLTKSQIWHALRPHKDARTNHERIGMVVKWKPRELPKRTIDYNDLARQLVAGKLDTPSFIAKIRGQA